MRQSKGKRGATVVYADRFIPKDEQKRAAEESDEPQAVPFLMRFTVFNVTQCDDLPERVHSGAQPMREGEADGVASERCSVKFQRKPVAH